MAETIGPKRTHELKWDTHEGIIKQLYIEENRPLKGPKGVMDIMSRMHQFFATRSQYETQFKKWKISKNHKSFEWKALAKKINARKSRGKESIVYFNGRMIPFSTAQKQLSRHGYMSTLEQINEGSPPQTPPGFSVCSPPRTGGSPLLTFSIPFSGFETFLQDRICNPASQGQGFAYLPLRVGPAASSIENNPMPTMQVAAELPSCQAHTFHEIPTKHAKVVAPLLRSLLPQASVPSSDPPETDGSPGTIIAHQTFSSDFLKLLVFSLSNNFAGIEDAISLNGIWGYLRTGPIDNLIRFIKANPGPTATELEVKLFQCAIVAGDTQGIRYLLEEKTAPLQPSDILYQVCGKKYTPIELAIHYEAWSVVEYLLQRNSALGRRLDLSKSDTTGCLQGLSHAVWRVLVSSTTQLPPRCLEEASPSRYSDLLEIFLDSSSTYQKRKWLVEGQFHSALLHVEERLVQRMVHLMFDIHHCPDSFTKSTNPYMNTYMIEVLAQRGDLGLVKSLLDSNRAHITPDILRRAVVSGKEDLVRFLLERDAMVSESSSSMASAYSTAIRLRHHSLIRLLESWGALRHLHDHSRFAAALKCASGAKDGRTMRKLLQLEFVAKNQPLLGECVGLAADRNLPGVALALLRDGADISKDGEKVLERAVKLQHPRLVRAVLDCDVNVRETWTLSLAIKLGDVGIVRDLVSAGALLDFNFDDTGDFHSALYYAAREGSREMVNILLDAGAMLNNQQSTSTALRAAVQNRDKGMVMHLLSCGADPDDSGALLAAVSYRRKLSNRRSCNDTKDPEMVDDYPEYPYFMDDGEDESENEGSVQYESENDDDMDPRQTGLNRDCADPDMEMVELLVGEFQKRYPRGNRNYGSRALIDAIRTKKTGFSQYLIHRKIGINPPSADSWRLNTPLAEAIRLEQGTNLDMVRMLLDAGIDANSIINESAQPGVYMKCRETALLVAIPTKHLPLLQLLVDYGASVNLETGLGIKRTPLQKAAELGDFDVVQFLLQRGADVNALPAHRGGGTALQLAAIKGCCGIVELLLLHGADINAPGAKILGRTALEGAAENGRLDTVKMLLDVGVCLEGKGTQQYENSLIFAKDNSHWVVWELLKSYGRQEGATRSGV